MLVAARPTALRVGTQEVLVIRQETEDTRRTEHMREQDGPLVPTKFTVSSP